MKLYVPLDREAVDKLRRVALLERRRPQDQAAVIIERALEGCQPAAETAQQASGHPQVSDVAP